MAEPEFNADSIRTFNAKADEFVTIAREIIFVPDAPYAIHVPTYDAAIERFIKESARKWDPLKNEVKWLPKYEDIKANMKHLSDADTDPGWSKDRELEVLASIYRKDALVGGLDEGQFTEAKENMLSVLIPSQIFIARVWSYMNNVNVYDPSFVLMLRDLLQIVTFYRYVLEDDIVTDPDLTASQRAESVRILDMAKSIETFYALAYEKAMRRIASGSAGPTPTTPSGPPPTSTSGAFHMLDFGASLTGLTIPNLNEWKSKEVKLSSLMVGSNTPWKRAGNNFSRTDGGPADDCALVDAAEKANCHAAFARCFDTASPDCSAVLGLNYDISPAMAGLKERIQSINPAIAFNLLGRLGFGYYQATEASVPVKGFQRYKVQDVDSWVQELLTGLAGTGCVTALGVAPPAPGTLPVCGSIESRMTPALYDQLRTMASTDKAKFNNFLVYLDVLVNWLNLNPQALNKEEDKPTSAIGVNKYPPRSERYEMYSYKNPYTAAIIKQTDLMCGLDRLKANILGETAGFNADIIGNAALGIPPGLESPFSRAGFTFPMGGPTGFQFSSVPVLAGGAGVDRTLDSINSMNQRGGAQLFADMYQSLVQSLGIFGNTPLSTSAQASITEKIEKLRATEQEFIEELKGLIEKNKLYQASRGYVNPFGLDSADYKLVAAKHANLLNIGARYNQRASNLVDIFQAMNKYSLDKLGLASTTAAAAQPLDTGSIYKYPLNYNIHHP